VAFIGRARVFALAGANVLLPVNQDPKLCKQVNSCREKCLKLKCFSVLLECLKTASEVLQSAFEMALKSASKVPQSPFEVPQNLHQTCRYIPL